MGEDIHIQNPLVLVGRSFVFACVLFQIVSSQRLDGVRSRRLRRMPFASWIAPFVDRRLRIACAFAGLLKRNGGIRTELEPFLFALKPIANAELNDPAREDARDQSALLHVVEILRVRRRLQCAEVSIGEHQPRCASRRNG